MTRLWAVVGIAQGGDIPVREPRPKSGNGATSWPGGDFDSYGSPAAGQLAADGGVTATARCAGARQMWVVDRCVVANRTTAVLIGTAVGPFSCGPTRATEGG